MTACPPTLAELTAPLASLPRPLGRGRRGRGLAGRRRRLGHQLLVLVVEPGAGVRGGERYGCVPTTKPILRFYQTLKESNAYYPTNLFSNCLFTLGVTVTVYSPRGLYETLTSGALGDSYLGGTG